MTEWFRIIGDEALAQLHANHREQLALKGTRGERDFMPVCKLFLPWTSGTWLLTEMDPGDGLAFGLADLGYPELGYISIDEIWDVVGPGGLRVERDIRFRPTKTLSQYAAAARELGYLQV
jgi:hypothetical protein